MARKPPLSAEMKDAIRELYISEDNNYTQEKLAELFKTSQSNISNIVRGVRAREYTPLYKKNVAAESTQAN